MTVLEGISVVTKYPAHKSKGTNVFEGWWVISGYVLRGSLDFYCHWIPKGPFHQPEQRKDRRSVRLLHHPTVLEIFFAMCPTLPSCIFSVWEFIFCCKVIWYLPQLVLFFLFVFSRLKVSCTLSYFFLVSYEFHPNYLTNFNQNFMFSQSVVVIIILYILLNYE